MNDSPLNDFLLSTGKEIFICLCGHNHLHYCLKCGEFNVRETQMRTREMIENQYPSWLWE